MTSDQIIEKVMTSLGDAVQKTEVTLGDAVVHATPENLVQVAQFLKDDPELKLDYLSHISGVDYLEQERDPRFEAVYELHSMTHGHSARIRVGIDEDDPKVPTVTGLWASASFPERELYDMFGIEVTGHPDLRRLIMPPDWEGHPLCKDYPLVWEDIAFSHNPEHKSELIKSKPEDQAENL